MAVEEAKSLKMGNGLDAGIEIGPMFEKKAMDNTVGADRRREGQGGEGADRRQAERRSSTKGYFFEPTVLRVDSLSMRRFFPTSR